MTKVTFHKFYPNSFSIHTQRYFLPILFLRLFSTIQTFSVLPDPLFPISFFVNGNHPRPRTPPIDRPLLPLCSFSKSSYAAAVYTSFRRLSSPTPLTPPPPAESEVEAEADSWLRVSTSSTTSISVGFVGSPWAVGCCVRKPQVLDLCHLGFFAKGYGAI